MHADLAIIDFDEIDSWWPSLRLALGSCASDDVLTNMRNAAPQHRDSATSMLLKLSGRDAIINATIGWIRASYVLGYHGTRVTQEELDSIRSIGLVPLKAQSRRARLVRALSKHAQWDSVSANLDLEIQRHGKGMVAGGREGRVFFSLSRKSLVNGFNHYLTHGSEFDQHVAHALLGPAGVKMLSRDGETHLITVAVPGDTALHASNWYFTLEDRLSCGEIPNTVKEFLDAWSYKVAHREFQCRDSSVDCGIIFGSAVCPEWIVAIESLTVKPKTKQFGAGR